MTKQAAAPRPFTGYHMLAIMVAFFGVVIVVNVLMARAAVQTFGGVVVDNSYVASQKYNKWLDEAAKEKASGMTASASRLAGNKVSVKFSGPVLADAKVLGIARHPLGVNADQTLHFAPDGKGGFLSQESLPAGRWRLRIELESSAGKFRQEQDIR